MKSRSLIALCLCLLAACGDDDGSQSTGDGGQAGRDASQDGSRDAAAAGSNAAGATADAATSDARAAQGDDSGSKQEQDSGTSENADASVPSGVPTFVAVGYAGVRIVSYDLGLTWKNRVALGTADNDDVTLLRTATYGEGVFVAAGHKIFTSVDGMTWTERTHLLVNKQWIGSVRYGNGRFVGAGGFGYSVHSEDGITWMTGDDRGTEAARSVAFGNGVFIARTDAGNWWETTDGETWAIESGGHTTNVQFCDGAFRDKPACGDHVCGAGVCLRIGGWDTDVIKRSTDGGATFKDVKMPEKASLVEITFGYTPE